jgi:hypothetical protein
MEIITLLSVIAPLVVKIAGMFLKTPAEKWGELSGKLLDLIGKVSDAAEKGKQSGDYRDLEDIINSRIR